MAGKIRWKRGDYIKLGRAVSDFNKKIKEIQTLENALYLPNFKDYKYERDNIKTREELNRVIKTLKDFRKEGQADLIRTRAGEKITRWEAKQVQEGLAQGLEETRAELKKETSNKGKPYKSVRERELRAIMKTLRGFNKLKGENFQDLKRRALYYNQKDREMKKAIQYRENFMNALKDCESFENYGLLKKKLNSIQNPIKFFEFIQQSDVLSDLFIWYDEETGHLSYGGFASNEDMFNYALEVNLGIDINKKKYNEFSENEK